MANGTPILSAVIQCFTNAGAPAASHLLFTYTAGTSTPVTTYTDVGLLSANTQPIVLDSAGRCTIFLTTGTSVKFVLAAPGDTVPTSPIWTRDNLSAVPGNDNIVLTGGLVVGFSGTVTADQIKLGDANMFLDWNSGTVPRWVVDAGPDDIRFTRATNTFEVVIANVAEITITTAGLAVANGIIAGFSGTPADDAIAVGDANFNMTFDAAIPAVNFDTNDQIAYDRSNNKFTANIGGTTRWSVNVFGVAMMKGADVVAAAAIVPSGNVFHVTGNTNITSITSTGMTAGTVLMLIFDGTPTFTDGSNLKLSANLVATADDTITLVFDGTNFYEIGRSVN